MRRKLKVVVPVLLLALGGGFYKVVLAPGGTKEKPNKIDGSVVPLEREFVVNLAGGHYGKVSVALVLEGASSAKGREGGALEQEAAVRAVITDELTGLGPAQLIDRRQRHRLLQRLESALRHETDEPITGVLLTDIAVQ